MSLACSPFLPPTSAMLFDGGSSLTFLHIYCSLRLLPMYDHFRNVLELYLPRLDELMLPIANNKAIDAALEVLQMERKREAETEETGGEGRNGVGDGITASATDQDEIMGEAGQLPAPEEITVDNVLKILVHNATEEFGFAPRDVYEGVLDLPSTMASHAAAVRRLNYSKLIALVETFSDKRELDDFSHRVVAVHPVSFLATQDHWLIKFKSDRIASKVVESMRLGEDKHLRETYGLLDNIPESSSLAGWVFEAIVHRMFSEGWRLADGSMPRPTCMDSDGRNPPTFSATGTLPSPHAPLRHYARTVVRINFNQLSDVTLDNNKYYIPAATDSPLFDSFTIDRSWRTVVISIFQITTSPDHAGSAEGYELIRKIILHVRKLLNEKPQKTTVKVVYFLVCPEGGSGKSKWHMPAGWDQTTIRHDHRGEAFCLYVPVAERHNTWCTLSTFQADPLLCCTLLLHYVRNLFTRSLLFVRRNLYILSLVPIRYKL